MPIATLVLEDFLSTAQLIHPNLSNKPPSFLTQRPQDSGSGFPDRSAILCVLGALDMTYIFIIAYLLRKSDVNEEELRQMSEHSAVQAAGPGAVEELLVTEPQREGGQVLVSHLPDQRLLLSAHLKCTWIRI